MAVFMEVGLALFFTVFLTIEQKTFFKKELCDFRHDFIKFSLLKAYLKYALKVS